MIEPYWGEFLTSPASLELSLNVCSGACVYCFANLNDPNRKANISAILRLLRDHGKRKSWAAQLLREGYPVLISNRSDPFSRNNYTRMLPILHIMHDMGIPMTFQTRGGPGLDDALEFLRPACWYVTVETMDDDLGKRLSPGTPPPSERLKLIRQLTAAGHAVVLGYNPCVPEWQPDPEPLLQAAKDAGVVGAWIETLHFDWRQARAISDAGRAVMGEELISRAQKRKPHELDAAAFRATRECATSLGLPIYSVGQPNRSDFWAPWYVTYDHLFPTSQGFVNWCHDNCQQGDVLSFDLFAEVMLPLLPAGIGPLDSYLGSTAHQLWRTHKVPTKMTFEQLLALGWAEPRARFCPARMPAFAYAGYRETGAEQGGDDSVQKRGDWTQFVDERGLPYLVFSGGDEWMFWYKEVE